MLNQLAAFWFEQTRALAPNHLISVPDPCVSVVHELKHAAGRVRDARLPHGLDEDHDLDRLRARRAHATAATCCRTACAHTSRCPSRCSRRPRRRRRASTTSSISREEIIASGSVSARRPSTRAARCATRCSPRASAGRPSRGLILVDTKYELAQRDDGTLVVVDEIHTPDSSRYWYRDRYERALSEGRAPEALDKEYVRRWLGEKGYQGDGPPPELPADVRCEASRRYIEAFEQITGRDFEPDTEDPQQRIRAISGCAD